MSPCINIGHSEKGKPVLRDRPTAASQGWSEESADRGRSSQMMKASLTAMTGGGVPVLRVSCWERINLTIDKLYLQTSAKTSCSQSGDPGSIPGQGTRSHLPPLRVWMLQLKIMHATTKTQLSQINNLFKKIISDFCKSRNQLQFVFLIPNIMLTVVCYYNNYRN